MHFIIRRKTLISMLFIGLTMLGYISYRNLPVELYPNSELPIMIVQISSQLEVDPKYMENQAIIPLEGVIGMLEGIEEIQSFANPRQGTIIVYYDQKTKIKYAYLKLEEKVRSIRSSIPDEFGINVSKVDTDQLANQLMSLEVRGSGGIDRVRNIVDQKIVPELENIDGIANAEVFGGREKSVEVILDERASKAHGITRNTIRNLFRQNNLSRAFVGHVTKDNQKFFVNVSAEFNDIRDLENIVVVPNGPILLKDIAEIFFGIKEETTISRVNGKEAITIQLVRDTQVNLIDLSHTTQEVIEKLNNDLKFQDIEIVIQSNAAEVIETNIDLIIELALIGGCLAIIILWMFLRSIRLVITIAFAIPISVLIAFNFFYAFDISINSLTLVGMTLAIGMLLDNSVVVLENIYRLASQGKDTDTAVIQGTKEVWRSIFAATLTTITVFLPFLFSSDYMIALIGRHVGVSIISTLLVSLFVAFLLIPMMTHYFLTGKKARALPTKQKVSQNNRLIQIYIVLLKSCMRFPARTIIGAVVAFFATVFICLALSLNISREVDSEDFTIYVTMPIGSTLENTDIVVAELEEKLRRIEEKKDIVSNIYEEEAVIVLSLQEDYESIKNRSIAQIKNDIQQRIDNFTAAEVGFDQPQSSQRFRGGSGANSVASFERLLGIGAQTEKVVIKGSDFEKMRNVADDIQYYLEELTSIQSVNLSISDNRPEVHLLFHTPILSQYNISLNAIASELSTFQNEFSSGAIFKQGTEEYDIIIRTKSLEEDTDKRIDDLKLLPVSAQSGVSHELQELSRIIYASGMSGINRVNQEKQIEVTYRFLEEVNESKSLLESSRAEIDDIISELTFPSGIAIEVDHQGMELDEFYFLIGAAFILIYMIMASVFESLTTPFVLMFSIPLAAIGSFLALILTGNSLLNANTLIGFLILLGVVVNNGIILIDYSRILRRNGFNRSRALMTAGLARVRPILITAITTMVALIPLALGKAEYVTSVGAPFAITVIGGLSLSTLFTLIFIPTLNSGLENALSWLRNLGWKIKLLQSVFFVFSCWLIYEYVFDMVWQFVYLFLTILIIPGFTYFFMTSLRQAQASLIRKDDSVSIKIQNLVKIYGHDSRFVREWKKGQRQKERNGSFSKDTGRNALDQLLWKLPLLGFLVYFTYFYLRSPFWLFILVHLVYFLALHILTGVAGNIGLGDSRLKHAELTDSRTQRHTHKPSPFDKIRTWLKNRIKIHNVSYSVLFWGFPFFNLILFQILWENTALVIFIGIVWYLSLTVFTTSNHLHENKINIQRLGGRFAGVRLRFYKFVGLIPVIGKKKDPFKALNGISLEIGKGMFGLLGPNGAGKTTLMRIICGILEQSYGRVRINGIDTLEKREELQGLIGYLPQEFGTYENMTAFEFLNYQAILKNLVDKIDREKRVHDALIAVHMEGHKNETIGSFSGGMKQRIGIAQILLHLPRILVVDEPTAGLDPRERIRFRNLLVELSRERIVIFSTHIIEDISSSCNQVAVLNKGNIRYLGEPKKMTQLADGHVWQFHVPTEYFEDLVKKFLIVHHMRDGDKIRVRCLSKTKPVEHAKEVRASLEDAYLWLQRADSEKQVS